MSVLGTRSNALVAVRLSSLSRRTSLSSSLGESNGIEHSMAADLNWVWPEAQGTTIGCGHQKDRAIQISSQRSMEWIVRFFSQCFRF